MSAIHRVASQGLALCFSPAPSREPQSAQTRRVQPTSTAASIASGFAARARVRSGFGPEERRVPAARAGSLEVDWSRELNLRRPGPWLPQKNFTDPRCQFEL